MSSHLFTSESVSEGHPDKVADRISDAVLDAVLARDPLGRGAIEVLVTKGLCVVAGETSQPDLDAASSRLEEARDAYGRGNWRSAISHGRASFQLLQTVLDQSRMGGSIAWILSVQGDVEYRRGDRIPVAYAETELPVDEILGHDVEE